MRDRWSEDYVTVMIDTDRMTGGADLAAELRGKRGGGIPWMVILDADGKKLTTSDGPKGNCGCPAQPHEIDHFLSMVDSTRRHMSAADRVVLERELRAYGAELVRPRRGRPGEVAFSTAARNVRFGDYHAAVKSLAKALGEGLAPERILTTPALRPLREDPDRRPELFDLLKEHVSASHAVLVDALEPGRRIRLLGRVVDMETGTPLAGALVHLYHTDARGEYRPGMDAGGGAGNPRLRAFLRTDSKGRFVVDTIMPERYPNSSVPRHVHYDVRAKGYPQLVSECFFDGDPNLSAETRANAPGNNFPIVELTAGKDGRTVGELTIRVPG